jgi:probable HAF family extracellular repeat protein
MRQAMEQRRIVRAHIEIALAASVVACTTAPETITSVRKPTGLDVKPPLAGAAPTPFARTLFLLMSLALVLATACQDHDPLSPMPPRHMTPKMNRLVADGEVAVVSPTAINGADEVLGFLWVGNEYHTGISVDGVGYDLGIFDTASTNSVYPEAINGRGDVVWFEIDGNDSYSLIWRPDSARATHGTMQRLPDSRRGDTRVTDLNDAGQAVGYLADATGIVLWHDGQVIDLPNPPGAVAVFQPHINVVGQIVGAATDGANTLHAFLWTPSSPNGTAGSFLFLDPPGGGNAEAVAVNQYGQVVISSFPIGRSWLWTPTAPNGKDGHFTLLANSYGDLIATDINNRGDISASGSGPQSPFGGSVGHAFLWRPATPNDTTGIAIDASPDVGFDYISGASAGFISEESNGTVQIFGTFADSFYGYDRIWTLSGFDVPQTLTASISWIGYAYEGREILFDGRGTVPYSTSLRFQWDLGDGTTATGSTASHTYADNGTYAVRLTVTDAEGHTNTASQSVLVSNVAPTGALVASPTTVNEGGSYVLTLSSLNDAPADLQSLRLALDCGDGRGYQPLATTGSLTCAAPNEASRTARAQIVDKDGAVTEYAAAVSVLNVAPAITILNAPATIAAQNTYTLSFKFNDPGLLDKWGYYFDWGDGTYTSIMSIATQGTTLSGSHRYDVLRKAGIKSANYTVTVSVIDNGGGVSTASVPVVVTSNGHP